MVDQSFNGRALAMAAAGGLSLLLAACDAPPPPPGSEAQPNVSARVRVLNADMMVIDGQHLRLAGVYAPQGVPDARCWAEALASKQATEAVRRMMVSGRALRFAPVGGQDPFGRQYAQVTLNGLDLAQTLYEEGLVAKVGDGFGWCGPISQGEAGAPQLKAVVDIGG